MAHQIKEWRHHLSIPNSATWSETGAGKTFPILSATEFRFKNGLISNCLYIAPNSILDKIANEIWLNTDLTCVIIQGYSRKKRVDLLNTNADIHIINYEALAPYEEELKDKYDCIIADEAHRIKGYNSKTSKALQRISKHSKYKLAATGTPICSAPEDMYGIYRYLDPSIFGTKVADFRSKWCDRVVINIGNRKIEKTNGLKKGVEDEFRDKCLSLAILHQKSECLDLPEKTFEIRKVSLSGKLEQIYKSIKSGEVLELPNGIPLELYTGSARYEKCSQICSGFIKYNDLEFDLSESPKLTELDDIISQRSDKKTVIWARHTHVIKTLINRYKYLNPAHQMGGQNNSAQQLKFQEDNSCRLIVNQTNICEGYELTASDCAVYFELPWSYHHFKQSQDRTHRKGSERHGSINYFYLITRNTIETSVLKILNDKKDLADVINENEESLLDGTYGINKE